MHPALLIAAKDLRQRVRDRSAFLLAVVVPLTLAAIFSVLFGPAATPRPFEYGVVDRDGTPLTAAFTREVLSALDERGVAEITRLESGSDGRRAVRDGDLQAVFVFPAGFTAAVQSDRPADLPVVGSVDAAVATDVARSVASSYTTGLNAVRVALAGVAHARPGLTADQLDRIVSDTLTAAAPVELEDTSTSARLLDVRTYFAAGMAVFFLLFTVQFGVSSLIDERAEGTLSRLLAAPVRRHAILVGKLLTSFVLGVVSLSLLIVGTTLLLGASWGDPGGVALLVIAGVLAATGITSVVASLARTTEQAGSWQAVVAVTLGLLGGSFFDIQQSGPVMSTLSLVTPHAWFMRGLGDLAGGGGIEAVLPAVGALVLMASLALLVAFRRIGRVVTP